MILKTFFGLLLGVIVILIVFGLVFLEETLYLFKNIIKPTAKLFKRRTPLQKAIREEERLIKEIEAQKADMERLEALRRRRERLFEEEGGPKQVHISVEERQKNANRIFEEYKLKNQYLSEILETEEKDIKKQTKTIGEMKHERELSKLNQRLDGYEVESFKYYVVGLSDTIYGIASRYGVPLNIIAKSNSDKEISRIYAGQTLVIPQGIKETKK